MRIEPFAKCSISIVKTLSGQRVICKTLTPHLMLATCILRFAFMHWARLHAKGVNLPILGASLLHKILY